MFRGYRLLIVALVGLALSGATPPKKQSVYENANSQTEPPPPPTSDYAPYSKYNPDPCYQAKDHDTADLCAQWRAAMAAEKAADASYQSNLIGAIGSILSFISICLVFFALRQTEASLKAARAANEIAHDTAKRELRAYLQPKTAYVEYGPKCQKPEFTVEMINSGNTPAYDVRTAMGVIANIGDPDNFKCRIKPNTFRSKVVIGGNTERLIRVQCNKEPNHSPLSWYYLVFGVVVYRDAFGKRRLCTFKFSIRKDLVEKSYSFGATALQACSKGNKAN